MSEHSKDSKRKDNEYTPRHGQGSSAKRGESKGGESRRNAKRGGSTTGAARGSNNYPRHDASVNGKPQYKSVAPRGRTLGKQLNDRPGAGMRARADKKAFSAAAKTRAQNKEYINDAQQHRVNADDYSRGTFNPQEHRSEARYASKKVGQRKHKVAKRLLVALLIIIAIVGVSGALLYQSADSVKADAEQLQASTDSFLTNMQNGDTSAMSDDAQNIAKYASSIDSQTSNPLWTLASYLPVIGTDFSNAEVLASSYYDLAQNALVPLASSGAVGSMSSIIRSDGAININAVENITGYLETYSPVITRVSQNINALGHGQIDQVNNAVDKAKTALAEVDALLPMAQSISQQMPAMLGVNGQTRRYLVVVQNTGSLRSIGGYPQAWGVASVTNGKVSVDSLADFASTVDGGTLSAVTAFQDEQYFWGADGLNDLGEVGVNPDFARDAQIWAQFWLAANPDQQIDGVVAITPDLVQSLLGYTNGVSLTDGTSITGDNLVTTLLHDIVISSNSSSKRASAFVDVTGLSLKHVLSNVGRSNSRDLLTTLKDAASNGNIRMWFASDEWEQIARAFKVSGEISTDTTNPVLGVYISDAKESQLGYYLDCQTSVLLESGSSTGSATYTATTTIANLLGTEGMDVASSFPSYAFGNGPNRDRSGAITTTVFLYAPAGGSISDVTVNGQILENSQITISGMDVWRFEVATEAAGTTTINYKVTTSTDSASELVVSHTPTVSHGSA